MPHSFVMECAECLFQQAFGEKKLGTQTPTLEDVRAVLEQASDLNELRSLSDLLVHRMPHLDVAELLELEYAVEQAKGWALARL